MIRQIETAPPPNSTYFTTTDIAPEYDAATETLTISHGRGTRRSWGEPQSTSTAIETAGIVAIHTGYSHKHRGSQAWWYYDRQTGQRRTWAQLDDETRAAILAEAEKRTPAWAKTPGKLRSQRRNARKA